MPVAQLLMLNVFRLMLVSWLARWSSLVLFIGGLGFWVCYRFDVGSGVL